MPKIKNIKQQYNYQRIRHNINIFIFEELLALIHEQESLKYLRELEERQAIAEIETLNNINSEASQEIKTENAETINNSPQVLEPLTPTFTKKFDLYQSLFYFLDSGNSLLYSNLNKNDILEFLTYGAKPINYANATNTLSLNLLKYNMFFFRFLKLNTFDYERYFKCLKSFKKIKIRKWRLKKRRLKKIKFFRKVVRVFKFKYLKKKMIRTFSLLSNFKVYLKLLKTSTLTQKIPLTTKVINKSFLELFYKLSRQKNDNFWEVTNLTNNNLNQNKKIMLYLRNFNKKPYWKLRNSRVLHWNFFYKKKTIHKQRYETFIKWYVKKYDTINNVYFFIFNYFTKFKISWVRSNLMENLLKNFLLTNFNNELFILPNVYSKYIKWGKLKKKNYSRTKILAKWSYLNFKRFTCPWLQYKKTFPKIAQHVPSDFKYFSQNGQFDPMTNYLVFFSQLNKHSLLFSDQFKVNFSIKLHAYRYKAN